MKTLKVQLPGSSPQDETKTVTVRKTGGRGSLNLYDLAKGAGIAAIGGAWIVIGQSLYVWYHDGGMFHIVWEDAARAAVAGFMGYININIFQQARVIIKAKELTK